MSATSEKRLYFLANPEKPAAATALETLRLFAETRCKVVGFRLGLDGRTVLDAAPDRIVVIGGDGTLIGVARSLDMDQVPLIGVNVGKLGFLTEYSVAEFKDCFDRAVADDALVRPRTILEVNLRRSGGVINRYVAINDCVVQAGPPFRIISLGVSINDEQLTDVDGDGVIVGTPIGSTAHSLSAGGPIMQPGVEAIILTPMNPHSLTHKPLVVEREAVIKIDALQVNPGTTLIIDGQVSCPMLQGDQVVIKRFATDLLVVRNPLHSTWHKLTSKLHWGRAPDLD
jgi:NAD+ kinase